MLLRLLRPPGYLVVLLAHVLVLMFPDRQGRFAWARDKGDRA